MIEAIELSKRYGSTRAVDQLTFTVRPGHVTGFLGPNGAGKSTTMRMILGLDAPTAGTVTVNGVRYAALRRPLHDVGAVLDVHAVHGGRSAYNHLLCLAQSNGIPARRVSEVLDLVGLEGVAQRRAGRFSLGMSQRLGLAAALLGDPPILICDEPVNGLDPDGILWIRTLLRGLAAEGRTVFVSSHLMSEMALTADRLIVIGQGTLLADASTADIIAASTCSYVYVRTSDPAGLTELLRTPAPASLPVPMTPTPPGKLDCRSQVWTTPTSATSPPATGSPSTNSHLAAHRWRPPTWNSPATTPTSTPTAATTSGSDR